MTRRQKISGVDYSRMVSMPIRDLQNDGRIVFCVDVYGVTPSDIATVGGGVGSLPMLRAVERLGLDPHRYVPWIADLPLDDLPRRRGGRP